MIETKKPEVILFNYTPEPTKTVALPVSAWTSDNFYEDLDEISVEEAHNNTDRALKAFHKVALEYIDTVWVIKNCSRAFQQQLTRTRLASFSIQSMRVVTKKRFATNGHYTMPPSLDADKRIHFHGTMLAIQKEYEIMLKNGMSAEDARGILPLNIHSDISMRINLNALYHMLQQRFCVNTQWEYRQVAVQMKKLIEKNLGPIFSDPMDAPCIKAKKCPMREEYCGVPIWKSDRDNKMRFYEEFVNWRKPNDKDWMITTLGKDGLQIHNKNSAIFRYRNER